MLFATTFIISLQANIPVINEEIKPIIKIPNSISLLNISPDKTSFRIAPNITGITIKKENFAASLLLFPKKIEVHIVAPDLEIPGIMASACDKPIINACLLLILKFFAFAIFVRKSNTLVQ